jgi:hypothetical protein
LHIVVHLQFTQRVVRGVAASERIYSYNTKVLYTAIYSLHLTIILVYFLVRRASQPLKLPLFFLQPREWHHDSTSDLISVHSSYSPLLHAFPLTQCYPQRVRCIQRRPLVAGQLFPRCRMHACIKAWGTCASKLTARNLHEHIAELCEGSLDSFADVLVIVLRNSS